jgi:hypothetical protein
VSLVQPSPTATADVEVVPVAPAQFEGDSISAGRAGTPEAWVVWPESLTLGLCVVRVESRALHGGAAEVMGAARGVAKVGEPGDEGAEQGLAVEPPRVAVGPSGLTVRSLASVPGVV